MADAQQGLTLVPTEATEIGDTGEAGERITLTRIRPQGEDDGRRPFWMLTVSGFNYAGETQEVGPITMSDNEIALIETFLRTVR